VKQAVSTKCTVANKIQKQFPMQFNTILILHVKLNYKKRKLVLLQLLISERVNRLLNT